MTSGTLISRVGPKGYIHGWIFVGAPGVGDQVFHPHHGHGTVTEAHSGHVRVRFDSGDHHAFPVRPDRGPGRFERMTDEELANELAAGEGQRFHHAVAELDRRDRAERTSRVKNLYAEKPKSEADRNRVYQSLVNEGENPEDAWSHAHGVDTEQMQKQAVIAQLRDQGYKGGGFDALTRDAFKHDVQRRVLDAETATNGYMLSRDGEKAGVDPWSLFTGPEARARKYASSELREWWDQNGRPTAADFQSTLMGHAASGGPRGGDFYRMDVTAGEAWRSAAPALPSRTEVLARARTEGHRAGRAYRNNGTMPETPGDFTSGPRLVRQAASQWHRGFEDGRSAPASVSRAETSPGDARDTERLHAYWVHGEGAAKIRWGEPDDFSRCVMHLGKYIRDPEGYCNLAHKAATGMYPAQHAAMDKKATGRSAVTTTMQRAEDSSSTNGASRPELFRSYPLEDAHVVTRAEGDGSGRLVEAYCAVFDEPAEIHDQEGHYEEEIDRTAFNKRIADVERSRAGYGLVKVVYNHGMTLHGTPAERFSLPCAVPKHISAESRGVLTRSYYLDTPLGNEVLEMWRSGAITAQSFAGQIVRSTPELRRGDRYRPRGGQLTRVRRMELGLREYGATPFPAYSGAELVGVRMSPIGTFQAADGDEEFDEAALPPDVEAATGEPLARMESDEHSARYHQHALYRLRSQELRESKGLVW